MPTSAPILLRTSLAAALATCLLLPIAACSSVPSAQTAEVPNAAVAVADATMLIPMPASLQVRDGVFRLDARTVLHAQDKAAAKVAHRFAADLRKSNGIALSMVEGVADGSIAFELDPAFKQASPEAYSLEIDAAQVRVRAGDPRGLAHGAATLWQLAASLPGDAIGLPALRIEDAPRFGWRGLMLDSARHFQSVDEIKQLIDAMALHKLNVLHWHLTDDQGWRIEMPKYPRLTSVGACRIPAGEAGTDPATGKPRPYCRYYTQAQIRDIVAYAGSRNIDVVPEFDMPGHVQSIVAAYPQYGSLGNTPPVSNEWGVHQYLFNVDEPTFAFIEDVLDEILTLFPSKYIHIGGDEAVKDQWKASPRVQKRMKELGIKDETALQSWFIKRLDTYLEGKGRRLLGWDEILDGGLPAEATVMSWRGIEGGIAAASQGHDVVMAPVSKLYLDYLQTDSPNEPPGRPTQVTLRDVYEFEPVPEVLDAERRKHILGLQANVWTEHMRTWKRVQHAIFPRIAAVAETGWVPQGRKDYAAFIARVPAQLQRYRALGIDYADTPFEVLATADDDRAAGTAQVTLRNPLGYEVRYTTDGSAPGAASPLYAGPIAVRLPVSIRAAAFSGGVALAEPSTHAFDASSLLTRTDEELATCPDTGRLLLRLEDDGPVDGERAIFNATIFYPCWLWANADLSGIADVKVRLGRMPYYFQLAHDEPHRKFMPAQTAHGELLVQAGGCKGNVVARQPLPASTDADGFIDVSTALPAGLGRSDLCFTTTGDTRPAMWVLDRVTLVPAAP